MKTAFLLSIAFAVVTVVSVAMVWQVLGAAGVWDSINSTIQEGIGGEDVSTFQIQDYVGTSRVLGFTMLVAAIDVILITASATLTAFLYNMAAALLGGIEVRCRGRLSRPAPFCSARFRSGSVPPGLRSGASTLPQATRAYSSDG